MRAVVALLLLGSVLPAAGADPQRIVSTSPSMTEMLYALGLGSRVVGVTEYCHFPPEVRAKPKIGSYLNPNLETVLSLRPDLVLVLREQGDLMEQLQRLGLPSLALQHNDLEGIYGSLEKIGERAGVAPAAARVVAEIRGRLDAVRHAAEGLPRRKTMFIVGRSPGAIGDIVAVGKWSFLNELISIAGGVNLFEIAASYYPNIPREEIYAGSPEVVIDMGDMGDTDAVEPGRRAEIVALWRSELPKLPAVAEGRVYAVADDIFVVPGPRVVEAAEALLRMIHPESGQ